MESTVTEQGNLNSLSVVGATPDYANINLKCVPLQKSEFVRLQSDMSNYSFHVFPHNVQKPKWYDICHYKHYIK